MRFMDAVREETGMSTHDSKVLSLHISHDAKCHWCNDPLPSTSVSVCDSICKAVNIDLTHLPSSPFDDEGSAHRSS